MKLWVCDGCQKALPIAPGCGRPALEKTSRIGNILDLCDDCVDGFDSIYDSIYLKMNEEMARQIRERFPKAAQALLSMYPIHAGGVVVSSNTTLLCEDGPELIQTPKKEE